MCVPLADGKTMAALREQLKLNDEFISAVIEGQPVKNFVGTDTRPPDSLDMVEMGLFEEAQRAMIRETATRAMEQVLGGDSTLRAPERQRARTRRGRLMSCWLYGYGRTVRPL
eukprot:COSAG01_NODE_40498_length_462_cov_22.743802_1_plen_113_part_00